MLIEPSEKDLERDNESINLGRRKENQEMKKGLILKNPLQDCTNCMR